MGAQSGARYDRRMVERDEFAVPWPEVFSLMWEAYLAGTIPVGAVVVDATGKSFAAGGTVSLTMLATASWAVRGWRMRN